MSDIVLDRDDAAAVIESTIEISAFRSSHDNVPVAQKMTISQLVERFSKPQALAAKGGPAWSPAVYQPGANRSRTGVLAVTALVMDIDDGTSIETFKERLKGYAYYWHTSYSHTPEHPKYRIVVFLTNPVPAMHWPDRWRRAQAWMEGHLDESTKDASRIYYMPSHPVGGQHFDCEYVTGAILDIDSLPAVQHAPEEHKSTPAARPLTLVPKIPDGQPARPIHTPHPAFDDDGEHGLEEVIKRCHAIRDIAKPANQPSVSEPLWRAMISNVGRFAGGSEFAHAASQHHPEYDEGEVGARIKRHVAESGPITCTEIRRCGYTGCPSGGCVLPSGAPTRAPAGLATWPAVFTPKEIPHPVLLRSFLAGRFKEGLVYANSEFHRYRQGAFEQLDQTAEVSKALSDHLGLAATAPFIKQLVELLMMQQAETGDGFAPNLNYLCLTNGTLNLTSYELESHSPEHRLRTRLDVSWLPEATAPRWLAYLHSVFEQDPDMAEKIAFLQQWVGYLLVPDASQQKMLWLVGSGANGKSVFLSIVTALVGQQNISNAMLDSFHLPYVRAELDGKLVNIAGEMAADVMINDGFIKAIVAADMIEAARKFKPSFSFRPFVRLMAATNNLPKTNDLTHGFFRRTIILMFNRQFAVSEQNPNLVNQLLAELPGILVWAIEGLRKLRGQGHFTVPPSSEAALEVYRAEANPVHMFAEECLVPAPNGRGMRVKDIFPLFQHWASRFGFQSRNLNTFGKALGALRFEQKKSNGTMYWKVAATHAAKDYASLNADINYDTGTLPANDAGDPRISELAAKYTV